ncbi:ABC transporter permease subunit [Streptomyces sp. NBC_01351]|uniref:ABC transporter permease n=1 Tax=Streptomyces sp. NBC_01351 TaxID=2903833 RepID=UPI002E33F3D6|nr:ABC transporter permease subunit [Streptomyces sp. NBC_01351]
MTAGRGLLRVASLGAALLLWQVLTSQDVNLWLRFEQFPTVGEVASTYVERAGTAEYWQDLGFSLRRIVTGFALAAVLGVAAGTALARSRTAHDLLGPLLEVARPVPAIALVPVAILLFPSTEQGIVFITFAAAFFPVVVSTRHAVAALTPVWEEAVLTMGGRRGRILFSVVLPGALPGIFGGLSVGIGVSWICVISAEMISGEYGVGYRTWQDYTVVDYPAVFVGMVTIGALGWLTSTAVERAGRRLTRWLPARAPAAPSSRPRPGRAVRLPGPSAAGPPAGEARSVRASRTAEPAPGRTPGSAPNPPADPPPNPPASPPAGTAPEPPGTRTREVTR